MGDISEIPPKEVGQKPVQDKQVQDKKQTKASEVAGKVLGEKQASEVVPLREKTASLKTSTSIEEEKRLIKTLRQEGRWANKYDDTDDMLNAFDENDAYVVCQDSKNAGYFTLVTTIYDFLISTKVKKDEFTQVHEREPHAIRGFILDKYVEETIEDLAEEGVWFNTQQEIDNFLLDPRLPNPEQQYAMRQSTTNEDIITLGIVKNGKVYTAHIEKDELIKLRDLTPHQIRQYAIANIAEEMIGTMVEEGRWCQTDDEMEEFLTRHPTQYAARQSSSDKNVILLGVYNQDNELETLRIAVDELVDGQDFTPENIRLFALDKIYTYILFEKCKTTNLYDIKDFIEEISPSGVDLDTIFSEVFTLLTKEPEEKVKLYLDLLHKLKTDKNSSLVLDEAIANYRQWAVQLLEAAIQEKDPKKIQQAFDFSSLVALPHKALWKQVIQKLEQSPESQEHLGFAKRVESHFEALELMKRQGIYNLSTESMLHISAVAEMKLQEGRTKRYLKKTGVGTAHSLLVDARKRTFTILLKGKAGYGPIKAAGGMGKVFSAIEIMYVRNKPSQATHVVQKVNKDTVKGMSQRELGYEQKYGTLKSIWGYDKVKEGFIISKVCFIAEAFDCDLFTRLGKAPPLTFEEKLDILDSLAEQLENMHKDGVVHNDLKLSNILWKIGKCVLSDFGLSFEPATMRSPAAYKGMYGTPEYSAPEMLQNPDLPASFSGDVYAFGLVAYMLLTNRGIPWENTLAKGIRDKTLTPDEREKITIQGINSQYSVRDRIIELEDKQNTRALTKFEELDLELFRLLDPNPATRSTLAEFRQVLKRVRA